MHAIEIQQLSIGYKQGYGHSKVVKAHLQCTIDRGRLTCLLGSNGIGKSTLLRTLAAFQPALSGQILIEGRPLATLSDQERAHEVSVVLTERPDIQNLTVTELVGLGRSPYTGFWGTLTAADHQVVSNCLQQVGIEHLGRRMAHSLSDGERQKVMIAKALAQQTPIILLDEPTAFLDFPSKVEMLKLLRQLAHTMQKTILLSTHDLELAVRLADTLLQLDDSGLHEVSRAVVRQHINELLATQ